MTWSTLSESPALIDVLSHDLNYVLSHDPAHDSAPLSAGLPPAPVRSPAAASPSLTEITPWTLLYDARNLLTALDLCCELLAEPGVVREPHGALLLELASISRGGENLVERMGRFAQVTQPMGGREASPRGGWRRRDAGIEREMDGTTHPPAEPSRAAGERAGLRLLQGGRERSTAARAGSAVAVDDLGAAVSASRDLLEALAGPRIVVEMLCRHAPGRLRLGVGELEEILACLVWRAAGTLPEGGTVRVTAQPGGFRAGGGWRAVSGEPKTVTLCLEDGGERSDARLLERCFHPDLERRRREEQEAGVAPGPASRDLRRVRALVEAAGGCIRAGSGPEGGTRVEMEFPVVLSAIEPVIYREVTEPEINEPEVSAPEVKASEVKAAASSRTPSVNDSQEGSKVQC